MKKEKNILDLHSTKHADAEVLTERFIYENRNNLPAKIITGNSRRMRELVIKAAKGMGYNVFDIGNFGEIDVY